MGFAGQSTATGNMPRLYSDFREARLQAKGCGITHIFATQLSKSSHFRTRTRPQRAVLELEKSGSSSTSTSTISLSFIELLLSGTRAPNSPVQPKAIHFSLSPPKIRCMHSNR
jgi:hypothetical protein